VWRWKLPVKNELTETLLFVAVSLLTLTCTPPSVAQTSEPCAGVDPPTPVVELIQAKFSEWRPKQVSDLDSDDQQLWLKAHEKGCPGIAVGRFESTDKFSYAVLLVPKSQPNGGYKIIIFSKVPRGDSYTSRTLAHADTGIDSGMVIATAPPGKYSSFDDLKSVTIKRDGLYVEWIEKGIELYFWSGSRYISIQISD
jgi:hypothetical protein